MFIKGVNWINQANLSNEIRHGLVDNFLKLRLFKISHYDCHIHSGTTVGAPAEHVTPAGASLDPAGAMPPRTPS